MKQRKLMKPYFDTKIKVKHRPELIYFLYWNKFKLIITMNDINKSPNLFPFSTLVKKIALNLKVTLLHYFRTSWTLTI